MNLLGIPEIAALVSSMQTGQPYQTRLKPTG